MAHTSLGTSAGDTLTSATLEKALSEDASGNWGLGTSSPDGKLNVKSHTGTAIAVTANTTANGLVIEGDVGNETGLSILTGDTLSGRIIFGSPTSNTGAEIFYRQNINKMNIGTMNSGGVLDILTGAGVSAMYIDASRNVLIGGTATPTSSVGNLVLFNGTIPSASVTNGVVLYSEDVSSSAELKVRDEASNITTLSPHNFSLIPDGPCEDMAWAYYSEKGDKKINVDMLKLARKIEEITGEKLVYESE